MTVKVGCRTLFGVIARCVYLLGIKLVYLYILFVILIYNTYDSEDVESF